MTIEQKIKQIESEYTQKLRSLLSPTKKNIVFLNFFDTYIKQFGTLPTKLAEKHNVLWLPLNANELNLFEGCKSLCIPRAVEAEGRVIFLNLDIDEIDLIISSDIAYDNNCILSKEFLSKKAKRLYMPHSLLQSPNLDWLDYIAAPSTIFEEDFKQHFPKSKTQLISAGYPKLDISLRQTFSTSPDTITYATTVRPIDRPLNIDAMMCGYDVNLIEWLLKNTTDKIAYRMHPTAHLNNIPSRSIIHNRLFASERLSFDEMQGSAFYEYTKYLITDFSTTAYTFSLTTLRPSIFFAPMRTERNISHHIDSIGYSAKNFRHLKQILDGDLDKHKEIEQFRKECIFNVGSSEDYLCDAICAILS
ncbi:hypothetical protein CCZ01_05825 [Helicobacter monodelphidis]|uniref:CDP-glycerol glycerophosphotransferase family protein n=1 Tax=Helicobacter sp. 15-1451 TaxID=2004995 RepID=UPI000DCD6EF0|nr:CDP-glycerol glycerophosphotransferase family protein [Helicobacter sp. 15-1451]RAX57501.1 hypothetical protein CCZ01_05825 [Helicobacter sp. 15-1451]